MVFKMYRISIFCLILVVPYFCQACNPGQYRQWNEPIEMPHIDTVAPNRVPNINDFKPPKPHPGIQKLTAYEQDFFRYQNEMKKSIKSENLPRAFNIIPDTLSDVPDRDKVALYCLGLHGMNEQTMIDWYNRVLNLATRTSPVSKQDQDLAMKCINPSNYKDFGIIAEGYIPPHTTPLSERTKEIILTKRIILLCLVSRGPQVQDWYDRVLNPATRTGRVSREDQDFAKGCVKTDEYLYFGVTPDGHTNTDATITTQAPVMTTH